MDVQSAPKVLRRVQQIQENKIRQEEYHEGNYGDV